MALHLLPKEVWKCYKVIDYNIVCVFVYSDLFLSGLRINDGMPIVIVVCMHTFTWLRH